MKIVGANIRRRIRRALQITSQVRRGMQDCLSSGQIAIAKENILARRLWMPRKKEIQEYRLKEHVSAMSRERMLRGLPNFVQPLITAYSHILSAAKRLANLDEKQVSAVATRIELDLRIGYAFTRFMTNSLRPLGGAMSELTLSYGRFKRPPHQQNLTLI